MSRVYLARDRRYEREVAVKVLDPEIATAVGAERFLREIRITAQLQHPHIVPLLESGEAAGLLYSVMPYIEGESLRDRLMARGRLASADASRPRAMSRSRSDSPSMYGITEYSSPAASPDSSSGTMWGCCS